MAVRCPAPRREPAGARQALDKRAIAIADAREWLSRHEQGAFQSLEVADVLRDLLAAVDEGPELEDSPRDDALIVQLRGGPRSLNEMHRALKGYAAKCGGRADMSKRLRRMEADGFVAKVPGGRGGQRYVLTNLGWSLVLPGE